jgi:hypothetical protein
VSPTHEPRARRSVTTRTARVWIGDDGILYVEPLPGCTQARADAIENIAVIGEVAAGRRPPALADMRGVRGIDRGARAYYAEAPPVVSAMALQVGSPLSRAVGTFFVGFNKPPTPTRLFTSADEARAWLRGFIA